MTVFIFGRIEFCWHFGHGFVGTLVLAPLERKSPCSNGNFILSSLRIRTDLHLCLALENLCLALFYLFKQLKYWVGDLLPLYRQRNCKSQILSVISKIHWPQDGLGKQTSATWLCDFPVKLLGFSMDNSTKHTLVAWVWNIVYYNSDLKTEMFNFSVNACSEF